MGRSSSGPSATPRTRRIYPKRMFHYDRAQNTLTCPTGVTVQQIVSDTC